MALRRREQIEARHARRAAVDDPQVVLDAAASFLATRPRSVAEVERRLLSTGYRPDLVAGAVARLVALGLLDDAAFGRAWLESRDRTHPRGEAALRRELALKGVPRDVAEALLADRRAGPGAGRDSAAEADPNEAAARRLLERHARGLEAVTDPRRRRQRAYGLLARNGFDPDTCRGAVDTFLGLV